jgi:hypothetical protein
MTYDLTYGGCMLLVTFPMAYDLTLWWMHASGDSYLCSYNGGCMLLVTFPMAYDLTYGGCMLLVTLTDI